jgi:hypothetical protein
MLKKKNMGNYKPKIIDTVCYNGEKDLFEIRYNILKDYVDTFIVVEFDKTFSGKPKEPSFKYKNWEKVKYYFIKEDHLSNVSLSDIIPV